jgi:DNA-binding HxlR family transcriptional regulator
MGRPEDSAASPGGAETLCHQVISRAPSAGTWATLIVRELLTGPKRFTEPRTALPGISPKTLSARLQRFVHTGLVTRTAYPEIPPRVEYQLTPAGARLEVVLATVAACAKQDLPRIG